MSDGKQYQATEPKSLEELIMSPTVPKNEAEWWASREIKSLRQQVDQWKFSYLEQVELHNKTLDELREAEQRVKELEDEAEQAGALVLNINAEKLRLETDTCSPQHPSRRNDENSTT